MSIYNRNFSYLRIAAGVVAGMAILKLAGVY